MRSQAIFHENLIDIYNPEHMAQCQARGEENRRWRAPLLPCAWRWEVVTAE